MESATLFKKWLWHRCFPENFAKLLRTPKFTKAEFTKFTKFNKAAVFFTEHPWTGFCFTFVRLFDYLWGVVQNRDCLNYPFPTTSFFLYPPPPPPTKNKSENQRLSDVYRGYRKGPVAWNCLWSYLLLSNLKNLNHTWKFLKALVIPAACISESSIKTKINWNFYFHTSFLCLKRFYEGP